MSTLHAVPITFLRGADSIIVRHRGTSTTIDGSCGDHRFSVDTLPPRLTAYGKGGSIEAVSWPLVATQHHKGWQTFAMMLRKGDEIRPVVVADNTSEALREVNVVVNELAIEILRPVKGKAEPKVMHFALDHEAYVRRAVRVGNLRRAGR